MKFGSINVIDSIRRKRYI